MIDSVALEIADEMARLREGGGDHFYGAWSGGSKAEGGHAIPEALKNAQARVAGQDALRTGWDTSGADKMEYALYNAERQASQRAGDKARIAEIDAKAHGKEHFYHPTSPNGWKGKPGSVVTFKEGGGVQYHVYVGDNGKPAGYVLLHTSAAEHPGIREVAIDPKLRGQGIGTKLYDALQDGGANLYDLIGRAGDFTPAGKAFATRWLEHRIEVESQRAGLRESEERPTTGLEWARWALARVRRATVSDDGLPDPEEGGPIRESGDDHFYGAWSGGSKSEGGHPVAGGGSLSGAVNVTHEQMMADTAEWKKGLSTQEGLSLADYQANYYHTINEGLRRDGLPPMAKREVADMDAAIARGSLKQDTIVYRAIDAQHIPEGPLVGATVSDKAFVSTSIDPAQGARFAAMVKDGGNTPAIMEIRLPKGTHGAYMEQVMGYSKEREWLLPHGQTFKVVSEYRKPLTYTWKAPGTEPFKMDLGSVRHLILEPA